MTAANPPAAPHFLMRFAPGSKQAWTVTLLALAIGSSLVCGYGLVTDQKKLAVLPIIAVVGIALAIVATLRFSWFVLLLLATRSSTDVLKLSASDAGTSAANTVGNRGPDPSSIIGITFLLFALLWIAALLYARKPLRPSAITVMLVVFVIAGGLSVVGSDHIQASTIQLARLMSAVLMFVVLEQLITSRKILKRVLTACFVALIIPLTYTLFGLASGSGSEEVKGGFVRLTGTFTQSNDYARFLAFFVILGVSILPYVARRTKRYLAVLLAVAGCVLVLTLTLGAIAGAFIGLLVIALIQRRAGLLAMLGVGAALALVVVPGLIGRITASTASSELGGGATGNSLSWRLHFWASLLTINRDNPVTGVGLNATQYFTSSAKQPHNDFLSAYVETGIVGLLAYLGLLAAMFIVTARAVLRTRRGTLEWGLAVGAFVCLGAFALMSVAANVIQSTANFWYILAITACASAAGRFDKQGDTRMRAPVPGDVMGIVVFVTTIHRRRVPDPSDTKSLPAPSRASP